MDFKTILIIVLGISAAAYFTPTPTALQTQFKSGQDLYAAKEYQKAIAQYDEIIGTESRLLATDSVRVSLLNNELNVGVRTAALYQKANALRNLNKKEESVTFYRAVEERTDSPKLSALAQYQIYEMYFADKDYPAAIREARGLIERHPLDEKVPQAYYDIGWAFRESGQIDSSNTAFLSLTNIYPEHPLDAKARFQIAQNYFDQSDWRNSIAAFQSLLNKYRPEKFAKAEWENVELKALRDRKLFEATTGKDVDASTLELVAKAQVKVGDNYRQLSMYDSAMAQYRSVIAAFSLIPTLQEATYIKMAEYTTEEKGLEEGLQIYRDAIDENFNNKPLQAKLQYKIARTYQEVKQYTKSADAYQLFAEAYAEQGAEIRFTAEQSLFLAVSNRFNAKDYPGTISTVDTMLRRLPGTEYLSKLHLYRALALSELKQYEESRTYLRLVREKEPTSNEAVIARTQLGKTYYEQRNYTEAISAFRTALAEDHSRLDTSEVYYYMGLSYFGIPDYDNAVAHLSLVGPTSSYYPYTFARVVRAYTSAGQHARALAYLDTAAATPGLDTVGILPFIQLAKAELFSGQQQFEPSVAEFDKVVQNRSLTENTRMQALYGRAMVLFEMGRYEDVSRDLRTCLNSGVFSQVFASLVPQAKEKLAYSLVYLNKHKEGLELVQGMVDGAVTETDRSRYLAVLAEFYFRSADYQKSVDAGRQLLAIKEKDTTAAIRTYVTLANSYGAMQQPNQAIKTLEEASAEFPLNAFLEDTFFRLAMVYFNGGDYANAADAFRVFMDRYPSSRSTEEAMSGYGYSLYQIGKADESIATYRAFLRKFPSSKRVAEARLQIGEAYFNTSRFAEATAEYQAVYAAAPESEYASVAMYNEAWSYFQLEQHDRMVRTFRTLLERYPSSPKAPDALFSIGDYYYNAKSYDSALVAYRMFWDAYPDDPRHPDTKTLIRDLSLVEAYNAYEKAMAYFEAKNWKQAIVELTSVMENYADTEVAYACKANIASSYEQLGESETALRLFNEIITEWSTVEDARSAVFFAELHRKWLSAGK